MLKFYRNVYYSLYLVAKKIGFKDAETAAKEYSGVGRLALYATLFLALILWTENFDANVKYWAVCLVLILFEVFVHWLIYSFNTHDEIEKKYNDLSPILKKLISMISIIITPLGLIIFILLAFYIKDNYIF